MSPFYEYFVILAILFTLSYTAPTLIKLLNTVTGGENYDEKADGDEKKEDSLKKKDGPSMITQIAKGVVMVACLYMVNVPVNLLLTGRHGRNNFFRPELARQEYAIEMAQWRAKNQPSNVIKVEVQQPQQTPTKNT